jgi:hypothetical protein
MAAIASQWLAKSVAHRFAGSGILGAFRIQFSTVLSEILKPSTFSSP